jgi:hypothetical protein
MKHMLTTFWARPPVWLAQVYWMDWVGIATLSLVAALMFISYAPTDGRRWLIDSQRRSSETFLGHCLAALPPGRFRPAS